MWGKTIPDFQFGGRFFDQTYQSWNGDEVERRASRNHGWWSEVWLTTRSMTTRIPRLRASFRD